uniref:Polymerase nucleotidyl transferase domain-containing protein n=1 Tax=Candidatus Kentrum sp. MB TaxID=2138164 RepID=A0A450XN44_9GAMM|nr:MAG: hypothetical protein BECKMB1821G_GA0114241_106935 [Candidatus Kentron sp. MB]VFK34278.1 MAG: hypothetical protein BECKMB1821I_GA0114274_106634 [Candidatus Kentron sp. MB]VFK76633.1 MAG: hypothetical protein BECKMB1821H_GA0114242_106536 [Candidatus Kentron sp. MB]
MTKLDSTLQRIREKYPYLSDEYGVGNIGVFGSVARGTEREDSDIDVVVELTRPMGLKFIDLVGYLEGILGGKVDVLTEEGVRNIRNKKIADDIRRNIVYV